MKVCLLTLHRVFNYGSALQTYATQTLVERTGASCEVVDYITPQRTAFRIVGEVPPGCRRMSPRGVLYILSRLPGNMRKQWVFNRFLKRRLHLSRRRYVSVADLQKNPPEGDVYLTGSDQVWNSDYNEGVDHGFFLDFGPASVRRIAYAASIAKTALEESEKSEIQPLLARYAGITVREEKARVLLSQMGFDSPVVLDPTLMLRKEEWHSIEKPPQDTGYILVMILYGEECGIPEIAAQMSRETGIPVREVLWNPLKRRPWKTCYGKKPEEFLGYVRNAAYVITNSFHVTAFSLNYEKQFLAVRRQQYNTRIDSLLAELGLSDRYIAADGDWSVALHPVDYTVVTGKLDILRRESEQKLACLLREDSAQ